MQPAGLVVEVSEIIIHKADEPNPLVGFALDQPMAGAGRIGLGLRAASGPNSGGGLMAGHLSTDESGSLM
jgi:hypothetical protein